MSVPGRTLKYCEACSTVSLSYLQKHKKATTQLSLIIHKKVKLQILAYKKNPTLSKWHDSIEEMHEPWNFPRTIHNLKQFQLMQQQQLGVLSNHASESILDAIHSCCYNTLQGFQEIKSLQVTWGSAKLKISHKKPLP